MKKIMLLLLVVFLCSCSTGTIHVAKDESESFKTAYEDAQLKKLSSDNDPLLREIYKRLRRSNIDIFKEGIGITLLKDQNNEKLHYFMVNIRPSEIVFDEKATTPEQRFSRVLMNYYPKYLKFVKKEDLDRDDIEGLALGVYWPVRDFSQCNTYGGFIEYIHIYFPKEDIWDMNDGRKSFEDVVQDVEIITSLDLKPAKNVRPVF